MLLDKFFSKGELMKLFHRGLLSVCVLMAAATGLFAQQTRTGNAGQVRFFQRTDSSWDQYTSGPNWGAVQWMYQTINRIVTYSPYFDSRLSWFPNAWAYEDLYGFSPNSPVARQHPDWVMKDAYGNPLYINWGCWGNGCNSYAMDFGNPAFQDWWIQNIQQTVGNYRGLWIDDVNMDFRVGYGDGSDATPWDPRTNSPMSANSWRQYVADFTQKIRARLPNMELVHNSIWYSGGPNRDQDPNVIREIQSADFINCERGISDPGLVGLDGSWSVNAFLAFVDHVHSLGRHVIFEEYGFNGEYGVSGYYLISDGYDGFSNQAVAPWSWSASYSQDLGNPKGPRYIWNGILRRDFANGSVLLNPNGARSAYVNMQGMKHVDGTSAGNFTLNGGQGAVLLY
jgi:hypothetical protein